MVLACVVCSPTVASAETVDFMRVRAILSDKCFACHGPDAKHREGDLRLDTLEGALSTKTESGLPALVPGNPDESELFARIISDDKTDRMPPKKTNKVLKPDEIALIKTCIEEFLETKPWTPFSKHSAMMSGE